ncbi:DEAD/DEAH box helicase [Candidatus Spongiisocius sp.]|uniref:DEAD/DEAH box helicase n=1 Tax=Candidatus Spongiisocius sp. TaxID=3101273 RepID=UPI003B5ABC5B
MDVFELREMLTGAYRDYATSFMRIRDDRIRSRVDEALDAGKLWPHPLIGLNPAFEPGGSIEDLIGVGVLDPRTSDIFRLGKTYSDPIGKPLPLYRHQSEAIRVAADDRNCVLTTGTGSGKSLAYIIPIVDHVLRSGSGKGVKAIVVYPMNALANSQMEELSKFLDHGPWSDRPVTFGRYTGQDTREVRDEIQRRPPDILLTNYVMLELILTRYTDRRLVRSLGDLRYLVLDEMHTYRGRQGADVAMLVRRLREASGSQQLRCMGTSATLSTEGGYEDRQRKLAEVSSRLFGAEVAPRDVIGETLRRVTPAFDIESPACRADLAATVDMSHPPETYADFVADPLASWNETTFGLRSVEGRLVRAEPRAIEGPGSAAEQLADVTGLTEGRCRRAIRSYLLAGNGIEDPSTGRPTVAFRLHQFVSRGDTVYASPESPADRYVTLIGQRFVPGDRARALLPLAFCRACGQDYYVVHGGLATGIRLRPRDLGDTLDDEQRPGFLYLSDKRPWPDEEEVYRRLPESWFEPDRRIRRIRSNRKAAVPRKVHVQPDGAVASDEHGPGQGMVTGWWTPAPFRFCLNCGVSYEGRLGRDFTRLTTLGSEGRSTATTIMSLATVRYLREDGRLPDHARKLLSFTDNRQDASLQSGHFNDFVQITLLRSSLRRALQDAGSAGLTHDQVPQRVFEALDLPFESYALDPDLRGQARRDTDRVFRDVLAYRIYRDLKRGWRLTQPNLEQAGLLTIEYDSLLDLAMDQAFWSDSHPVLSSSEPEQRGTVLKVLLDWMRRELALRVDVLNQRSQERLILRADQRLIGPWSLADERRPEYATEVLARPRSPRDQRSWRYVSARGGFGQFIRRPDGLGGMSATRLTLDDTTTIIEQLFDGLRRYGLVTQVGEDRDGNARWQVPAAALVWKAGDGTRPYHDRIRMPNPPDEMPTNRYFVDLYRSAGASLVGIEAREHTAQVTYEERVDREERFRRAELAVLYCSPTMELGVDISELNVVNMRNVPPTPANYAQRSGRAGRSGQPALVFTYCSAGSSHDQYFFRRPDRMIAGQVEAPRIELANKDLIRAHVHAVWLAVSGLNLGRSMGEVLDLADGVTNPDLLPSVRDHLQDASARAQADARARALLSDLVPDLETATWWSEGWLRNVLRAVPRRFEEALRRWKSLYAAAVTQQREQNRIALSNHRSPHDRRQAQRLRREAEHQLDILRASSDLGSHTDFYPYRYFAAEGFLPGYSFPRLPLSAFIPGRRGRYDQPEFLQRPRFLAISEFGPQTFIYHEGARYRINRVILTPDPDAPVSPEVDDDSFITARAKRCESCGYMHRIHTPPGPDVCEYCRVPLGWEWSNLLQMQNVSTVRRDRITSDEEERRRVGYEVISGVRFADRNGRPSVEETEVLSVSDAGASPVLRLTYGDTATIWRVNLGWRRRQDQEQRGFILDIERGYWGKSQDQEDDDPMSNRTRRVIPFVTDSRNALLIEPSGHMETEEMASLGAALKAAIEVEFQLESDELAVEPLPSRDDRRLLLFYESAEGGAGVLRRLMDEHDAWRRVARQALSRCHFDPDSGEEVPDLGVEPCEAACYGCLLTYRNQLDHGLLDRKAVKETLWGLLTARLARTGREELQPESSLEAEFLAHLEAGGYRQPDRDQVYFESARTRPDFIYDEACVVVYVDGPHHDYPERRARDRESAAAMRDLGYLVIRFGYRDDWDQIICEHPSVFGAGHTRESVS